MDGREGGNEAMKGGAGGGHEFHSKIEELLVALAEVLEPRGEGPRARGRMYQKTSNSKITSEFRIAISSCLAWIRNGENTQRRNTNEKVGQTSTFRLQGKKLMAGQFLLGGHQDVAIQGFGMGPVGAWTCRPRWPKAQGPC